LLATFIDINQIQERSNSRPENVSRRLFLLLTRAKNRDRRTTPASLTNNRTYS